MIQPKRGPTRPLTPEDLRDALSENNRDIVGHFTKSFGKVYERLDGHDQRFDRLEAEIRTGFQSVHAALDATLELFPTRKEVQAAFHRLARVLKSNGIPVEPDTLLPK
jgi:hypothetical protein